MKKLISVLLTVFMLSSMALPIFASDTTVGYDSSAVASDSNFSQAIDLEMLAETSASGYDATLGFSPTLLASTTYFYIDSVEGWNLFAKIVAANGNDSGSVKVSENPYCFYGKTVYLKNDIDFNNAFVRPIGEDGRHEYYNLNTKEYLTGSGGGLDVTMASHIRTFFSGTFDGRGHSIKNLKMTSEFVSTEAGAWGNAVALFKTIRGDATIKNLVIDSTCSFENACSLTTTHTNKSWAGRGNVAASLVAYAVTDTSDACGDSKGYTIENVISSATVGATSAQTNRDFRYNIAGGLVAFSTVSEARADTSSVSAIKNSTFAGTISEAGYGAGGILACAYQAKENTGFNITNCLNSGSVTARGYAGGVLGYDCSNNNPVVICTIESCKNSGEVKLGAGAVSADNKCAGAIIGADVDAGFDNVTYVSRKQYTVKNCENTAASVTSFIGYYVTTAMKITGCTNNGTAVGDTEFGENDTTGGIIDTELTYEGVIGYNKDAVEAKDLTDVAPICGFLVVDASVKEFKVSTPNDLVFLANIVNSGVNMDGYTVYLENDLDMTGVTMKPIGSPFTGYVNYTSSNDLNQKNNSFAGTFDGQGHVIDNLVMESNISVEADTDAVVLGLFGMTKSAVIKNVVLGGSCSFKYTGTAKKAYVAGIVAVGNRMAKTDANGEQVGMATSVENCYSAATVESTNVAAGIMAVVASNNNNIGYNQISGCTNAGNITAGNVAGGIAGTTFDQRRLNVINSRNTGSVTVTASEVADTNGAAGIYALPNSANAVSITYCINNGTISGPTNVGGILGFLTQVKTEVKYNSNYGTTTVIAVGGAMGSIYGDCEIDVFTIVKSNAAVSEKTDATNVALTLNPTYPNYTEIDSAHSTWVEQNTPDEDEDDGNDGGNTSNGSTDETQGTEAANGTTSSDTEQEDGKKKSGCRSTVGAFSAVAVITGVVGLALKKRKED